MSCTLGRDGSAPDIAAAFFEGPAPARRLRVVGSCSWTSASVQLGDEADGAGRGRSAAAYPAVEREALAGFLAAGLRLRRAFAGPTVRWGRANGRSARADSGPQEDAVE